MGTLMVPGVYSSHDPYRDIDISLISFWTEERQYTDIIVTTTLVSNNGNTEFEQWEPYIYLIDDLSRK